MAGALAVTLGLTLTGCLVGPEDALEAGDSGEVSSHEAALFSGNTDGYWSASPVFIHVCWKNPTIANWAIRDDVRRRIEGQWSRWARVNFNGWGDCAAAPSSRHVEITLDANADGGQCPWTPDPKATDQCWFGTRCVASQGVGCLGGMPAHEIGHALGFYHEEERLDYDDRTYWGGTVPAGCERQDFCRGTGSAERCPAGKQAKLGGYDPQSIMSYCAAKDAPSWLSPNDIASVQHVYGFRKAHQVVSPMGNCAAANVSQAESFVFSWDCDEAPGQLWTRNAAGQIYSAGINSSKCWGWDSSTSGSLIKIKNCAASPAWTLENVQVIGYGGKCLDLQNGNRANGTKVQTWKCLGNANQRWSVGLSGEIRFGSLSSTKCLTVQNNGTANGTKLVIWDCKADLAGQKFITSGNQLRLAGATNKCVDVPASLDSSFAPNGAVGTAASPNLIGNGQQLQVWDCLSAQLNQRWFWRGALRSGGKCLDLPDGTLGNGRVLQLWDCLGNGNQEWDVYF